MHDLEIFYIRSTKSYWRNRSKIHLVFEYGSFVYGVIYGVRPIGRVFYLSLKEAYEHRPENDWSARYLRHGCDHAEKYAKNMPKRTRALPRFTGCCLCIDATMRRDLEDFIRAQAKKNKRFLTHYLWKLDE